MMRDSYLLMKSPEYAGNTKPVKRVLINDNTLPAVKKRHWQILKIIVISKGFTLRRWRVQLLMPSMVSP
nr:hypothetical protein [Escherichia coli]